MFENILTVLCEMFSITPIMTDGLGRVGPTAWSPCSPDLNPLDFYLWGHLKSLMYESSVNNEEMFHHHIVDACWAICNYPGIVKWMWWSVLRCVLNFVEDIFSN
jgi:hypothetical protein